ncbi:MAG: hypothetical protein HY821_10890 [Acidobacteria bacterium]|nr:hypothetical protein [Acidobacteriota bacterium]
MVIRLAGMIKGVTITKERARQAVFLAVACILLHPLVAGQASDFYGSSIDTLNGDAGYFFKPATVIVFARVTSNEMISEAVPARLFPEVLLVQRRVRCQVIEYLKGAEDAGEKKELEFTYYTAAEPRAWRPIYKTLFRAQLGRKYIFSLVIERGALRSVGDVGSQYAIEVHAEPVDVPGALGKMMADQVSRLEVSSFGARIAEILLSPCGSCDPIEFGASLSGYRALSEQFAGRYRTFKLLRRLISEALPIRKEACWALNSAFLWQASCLEELSTDERLPEPQRQQFARQATLVRSNERELESELADPARLGWGRMIHPDSLRQNYEELLVLREHSSPKVRALASAALRRYYPRGPVR